MDSPVIFAVCGSETITNCEFEKLFHIASTKRRERANRFYRREDASRSLLAEAILKYSIINQTGKFITSEDIEFNEYGKPMLPGTGLHFNISHSGEWVVCAISNKEIRNPK